MNAHQILCPQTFRHEASKIISVLLSLLAYTRTLLPQQRRQLHLRSPVYRYSKPVVFVPAAWSCYSWSTSTRRGHWTCTPYHPTFWYAGLQTSVPQQKINLSRLNQKKKMFAETFTQDIMLSSTTTNFCYLSNPNQFINMLLTTNPIGHELTT